MSVTKVEPSAEHPPSLFAHYTHVPGSYDELLDAEGNTRFHWRPLVASWENMEMEELDRRLDEARRLSRENGVTYAARAGLGDVRPWDIDAFPLVLAADEWQELAAGIAQRACLLDTILGDLYTDTRLLAHHDLPPELVFGNPGFVRPCFGYRPPENCFLHLYAADVVRGPEGQWRVVSDFSDAPMGLGYALETRILFARMFPALIRDCRIERLAMFFIELQQTLRELAPSHRENPRVVLLSEGVDTAQHFEDAYLARYLNYTLAEAGDLAVRDEKVVLKTLGGLLPVDVILRRLPDRFCDPLEFQGDATRGVPGLMQAVRAGNVAVVNALGSSLVETPALLPELPALCERLLQQPLRLPSVDTWWSGADVGRREIQAHAGPLTFRETFPVRASQAFAPETEVLDLVSGVPAHLLHQADGIVAQQQLQRSTAPVKLGDRVATASISLRLFAVWTRNGYQVLPGGLARGIIGPAVCAVAGGAVVSKDIWVVATSEVPAVSLLQPPNEPIQLRRGGAELPSRVADNMFWLGRYVERADAAARMLRTLCARMAAESQREADSILTPLLRTLVIEEHLTADLVAPDGKQLRIESEGELASAMLAPQPAQCGFLFNLESLARTADLVRDRLSLESWSILNRLRAEFQPDPARPVDSLADLLILFGHAIASLAAFGGMAAESMTRSQGWRFMELGRRLERSLHTIVLVQNFLLNGLGRSAALQEMLLEVGECLMTYRSRYLAQLRLAPVLDLLLTDETNPRSVAYQLAAIAQHVSHLPHGQSDALLGAEQRLALNMLNSVRQVDVEMLQQASHQGERNRLDKLLNRLIDQLPRLSELVSHRYFVHAGSPRQLAEWRQSEPT